MIPIFFASHFMWDLNCLRQTEIVLAYRITIGNDTVILFTNFGSMQNVVGCPNVVNP